MKIVSIIIFIIFSFSSLALDEASDGNVRYALEKIDQALELQKNQSATERAEFYYESVVDEKAACTHCPEYLSLIKEVNKIVEKIPTPQDVKSANRQLVQIDRLKFMYYEVVSSLNGNEVCSIFENKDPIRLKGVERDHLTLLSEELLALPNVTSVQFYPNPPEKEIRYLYQGEGLQSHILIEVVVKEDKTAVIRYHHYNPYNLPDIGGVLQNGKFNEFDLASNAGGLNIDTKTVINVSEQTSKVGLALDNRQWVSIEARHRNDEEASIKTILPLEISLPSEMKITGAVTHEQKENLVSSEHDKINRTEINISSRKDRELVKAHLQRGEGQEELWVGTQQEIKLDSKLKLQGGAEQREVKAANEKLREQKFNVALSNEEGNHQFVKARIERVNENETLHLSTSHVWDVDEKKGLKLKTEATQVTTEEENTKYKKKEMILSLTDHNHEYVTARVVQGDEIDRLISFTSRYGLGDNNSVDVSVDRYDSGKESFSIGHQMKSGKNSFQTSVGRGTETGNFINFKAERKISERASMILTVQADSNQNTTMMYQYQSKF